MPTGEEALHGRKNKKPATVLLSPVRNKVKADYFTSS
jgi:hypothetical protein